MRHFLLVVLFSNFSLVFSQEKYTISGYIKDAATGEDLVGCSVIIKELNKGTVTNVYGFYSITLEDGEYGFTYSYIGYNAVNETIILNKDIRKNINLEVAAITTEEVVITGERKDQNVQSTEIGVVQMEIQTIKELPALMGEVDVLKTIQLLPGVQSAGEGNSGFYVRGGGPDQNLILLDEAVVYNASHLFGFFSVFNSDAIKDINLIKGGMPANYGGRLSSVLDLTMKDGNNHKYGVEGGIGVISSRLTVEGPIKKEKSSFIVSGRRTYGDVLAAPFIPDSSPFKGTSYYFYDINAKVNHRFSDKDRIYFSGYYGRDVFHYSNTENGLDFNINWGNATASMRWNHLFTDRLFMNTSLIFSDYNFEFGMEQNDFELKMFSGIRDANAKVDFTWFPNLRHHVKYGINYTYHIFTPSNVSAKAGDVDLGSGEKISQYGHEGGVYVLDEFDLTEKIKINAGLRYSFFEQVGPFDRYVKNELGQVDDTVHYRSGENVAFYHGLEPRFTIRYTLGNNSSLKAAYTQNYQYVHMASFSGTNMPTDLWIPSSDLVKPQFAVQYAVGYFQNFLDNRFETSVELYYKMMNNVIEFKEGALPSDNINDNPDNNLTFGEGESYGAELFLKKRTGSVTGWIGYTLSWTTRTFEQINNGDPFPAKYDRRHDVSLIVSYDIKRWTLATIFVYATGNTVTYPIGRYLIDGYIINEYAPRNSFRMPAYHRLDLSATFHGKETKKFKSDWVFSIYNVYNRYNPYFIYFETLGTLEDNNLEIQAKQISLFPIIPSITWNFKIK